MKINVLSIIRAFLVLIWFLPFMYIVITSLRSYSGSFELSDLQIQILFIISLLASFVLLTEWVLLLRLTMLIDKAFVYINNGEINKLDNILKKIKINKCKNKKQTLLHYAVDKQMSLDIILYLLSKNALISYDNEDKNYNLNYSLFYIASYYDLINTQIVNYFIDKGAYINFIDDSRGFNALSLLQVLVLRCHTELVNLLISKGADVHYTISDLSMNTLMLAAKYINNPEIITSLVNNGSNVNQINNNGYNALLFASEFNPHPQIIITLLKHGAKIAKYQIKGQILKVNDVTPLRLAVINNNHHVVETLIRAGDDVDYKDIYGLSILFIAASHNKDEKVVQTLIDNDADILRSTDNEGNTPLMGSAYLNSNPEVIKYLISMTSNLGQRNQEGLSFIDYLKDNQYISEASKQEILQKFF